MSTVADYKAWLEARLEEARQYPEDTEVVIEDDTGNTIMDGGDEDIIVEEILSTELVGDTLKITVVTNY